MTEFKLWVIVVTLQIFLLFVMSLGLVYLDKKIKKAEAIVTRAEQVEKKHAKPRLDPKPDDGDGL
jgi:hypothetical protein